MKILWLAPILNHYKIRFLNYLNEVECIDLHVMSGAGREGKGDADAVINIGFSRINLKVPKTEFGHSKKVRRSLRKNFHNFDWVMIPTEKKNLILFLYALWLRKKHKNVRLFSYNHPQLKSKGGKTTRLDLFLTLFFNRKLDRVIFYTQESCQWAINEGLIHPTKAFWANNTIDTREIKNYYQFELPEKNDHTILYIGRLIPSKRLDILIDYFTDLKQLLRNCNISLKLEIIGDGPESEFITEAATKDGDIYWHGSIVDEDLIAPIMKRSCCVFLPGLSGLSINHAFSYGRPFITLASSGHGPEINYLEENKNGLYLTGDKDKDLQSFKSLFINRPFLEKLCYNAKIKGDQLSVENWVDQIKASLIYE